MKKFNLVLAVLASCIATSTFAANGTITFNGELVGGTCTATVNGGSANATVTLPTLSVSALGAAVGTTAGTTPFSITLAGANCETGSPTATTGTATPYFENVPTQVNSAGRLINTASSGATNVDVQLVNNANNVINITDPAATQATSTTTWSGTAPNRTGIFNYVARYYSTANAAVGAGAVTATTTYSITYK